MKALFGLMLLSIFCLGCASSATPQYKLLTDADHPEIGIEIFNTKGATGERSSYSDFGELFAKHLTGGLQKTGYKVIILDTNSNLSMLKYLIKGEFSQIEAGSGAARFWVGCGAGAARMTVTAKLIRVEGYTEIGSIKESSSDLISLNEKASFSRILRKLSKQVTGLISPMIQEDERKLNNGK